MVGCPYCAQSGNPYGAHIVAHLKKTWGPHFNASWVKAFEVEKAQGSET